MMKRLLIPIAIVAAVATMCVVGLTAVAHATVVSAEIEKIYSPNRTPYVLRNFTDLLVKPLKMRDVKGNPTVTFRIYLAHGEERDPARFTLLCSYQQLYAHYEMIAGNMVGWRLDTSKTYVPFSNSLRAISGDVHSVYITADDGTGECPPSNIVTFELMPEPAGVFQPPVISNIRSPAAGVVVFNVGPVVYSGKGDPVRLFNVYRGDGRQLDYTMFTGVGTRFGPTSIYDSTSIADRVTNEVVVVGLKKGETSFHLMLKLEHGEWSKGIASNILTVDVAGTAGSEGSFSVYMNPIVTLGVDRDMTAGGTTAGEGLALYPNPADRLVNLHAPFSGHARVRVLDLLGTPVSDHGVMFDGGHASIDISGLRAGRYVAIVERDRGAGGGRHVEEKEYAEGKERVERIGFIVVR